MTKTQPPPALDPRRPLPTDEVAQTYARDAARKARLHADDAGRWYPLGWGPQPRDPVELEVDALFDSALSAEAIVAESERPRSTVLSRAVVRANARRLRPEQQQALDEALACPGMFVTVRGGR